MDARASVLVVPPAGAPPPSRAKSLRQQRASNGAAMIKAYVEQSEQRREQSKVHTSSRIRPEEMLSYASPRMLQDERWEDGPERYTSSPRSHHQQDAEEDGHALDALFAERPIRQSRRPSVAPQGRQVVAHLHASAEPHGGNHSAMKPILRRRLQMESLALGGAAGGASHHGAQGYRPATTTFVPHHPRARHNLGAKLDALAKTSMLNRRKVVVAGDDKAVRNMARNLSPRHGNNSGASGTDGHQSTGSGSGNKESSDPEVESRVMTAFRQIVRLWRERKRRVEAAALTRMNGGAGGVATGTGRNGSKLRKDLTAQQANVVGIISRRLIREIPALKFFDEETDSQQQPISAVTAANASERPKPRGVCYTLDTFGCRKIKMQSSTTIDQLSRPRATNPLTHKQQKTGNEELTLEKATHRSLHRKMARRIKSRRQTIVRLGDEFSKARNDLAMKLRSQLALQHAQIEKLFSKRLTLLTAEDTTLPPYMAQKELHLARVRCSKAKLLEKCETLRVLGLVLKQVEAAGLASGIEVSTGELHFLDLFRCVVEENHVLTPIISNAIRQHMRSQDLKQPLIMEMFAILDLEMHRSTSHQQQPE